MKSSSDPVSHGAYEPLPISPSVRRPAKQPISRRSSLLHLSPGPTKSNADRCYPAGSHTSGEIEYASASEPQGTWCSKTTFHYGMTRHVSPDLSAQSNAPLVRAARKRGRVSDCDAYPDHSSHNATNGPEAGQAPLRRSYIDFLGGIRTSPVATQVDPRSNSSRDHSQRPTLYGPLPDIEPPSPQAATSTSGTSGPVSTTYKRVTKGHAGLTLDLL